jgi:S1-C subfamily serine protease
MLRHPGVQAVGVTLATVLCCAFLPQLVAPGYVAARSENSHGESPQWAAPARPGHQATPTGQPTVAPAKTPSTVAPPTTTTSPQQVSPPRTFPSVSTIPSPARQPNTPSASGEGSTEQVNSVAVGAPSDTSAIAQAVDPTLVELETTLSGGSERFGTGIVLTSLGEILTNNHVVSNATRVMATDVGNGQTYGAVVVGADPAADVAVLQLDGASGLVTATLGDSASLALGEGVVGIGNANGAEGAPSYAGGSVTALQQPATEQAEVDGSSEQQLNGLVETDAQLIPGDSGGPLVDADGEVVGIDTATATYGTGSYAIPIDEALAKIAELLG